MGAFKQFLTEGGKATLDAGTERATQKDINKALDVVSRATRIPRAELEANLLGSAPITFAGHRKDSGDIDIAIDEGSYNRARVLQAVTQATGYEGKKIGADTVSFAVDVGNKKVQVDLMFTRSPEWARWMYHSEPGSAHKGKVRNALLRAVAATQTEKDKDLIAHDADGNMIVKVRRTLKNEEGLIRLHKVAKPRKDGKGRVKSLSDATKADIDAALSELGVKARYSMEPDQVMDPDQVARLLFGKGVKASDLLSAEQVAERVLKLGDERARAVVKQALGPEMDRMETPKSLQHLLPEE